MSRLAVVVQPPAPPIEHPELQAAYAEEVRAVRLIADLKTRKRAGAGAIETAQAERDALVLQAAKGMPVTGADLRRATEAVADAEAELQLATETLPKAVSNAYAAARDRGEIESKIIEAAYRPYRDAAAAAEIALKAAQAGHAKAVGEAERLPPEAQDALDDLLDRHGRGNAGDKIEELRRLEGVNRQRSAQGMPLMEWP